MTESVLSDLKVADFTQVMSGPYCTRLMAAAGADIVKVEPPGGEHVRTLMPLRDGRSAYFGMMNAGKRSIMVDLRNVGGREAARGIIDWADVVIENFRPGIMGKYGLDYQTVAASRPDLVYCSISGYGQDGPWATHPAVAQIIHAVSGYDLELQKVQHGQSEPLATGPFIADALGGALAFGGILAALHARESTGVGRYVDCSMLDGMLTLMPGELAGAQFPDLYHRRNYPPYRTRDGFVMIASVNQRNFEAMCRAMGRPDLIKDPRFVTNPLRWKNTRTTQECERIMLAEGAPAARYRRIAEAFENEQCVHRGTFTEALDEAGSYRIVNSPFRFSGPAENRADDAPSVPNTIRVPTAGEHSLDILREVLGGEAADRIIASGGALIATSVENQAAQPTTAEPN
jgi:CoA:oxalate CoA-transferase